MNFDQWIPSLTTTALLAIVGWLCRNLITTRLTKSVEGEFNAKLEKLRASLRENEEALRAEIRAREVEIAALRSAAMTALASRQVAIDKRKLEAVDQLWSAMRVLIPAKSISRFMGSVNYEVAQKEAPKNQALRAAFNMVGTGFDPKVLDLSEAQKARPFVSPMAWATFSAYLAISMQAVLRLQILKSGVDTDFVDTERTLKVVKAALPERNSFIEEYGTSGFHLLLEELEQKLLQEFDRMLSGKEADFASIQQAAEILKWSNDVIDLPNANPHAEILDRAPRR